jgi:long-subunit fatty acid transport protein
MGYYFTEDNQPLLFQKFNNEHFEFALQLKLMYNWKNFRPFAGILLNNQTYKMQFLTPENDTLTKLEDFKSTQTNLGFSLGLQYRLLRRFIISAEYQHYSIKNISLKKWYCNSISLMEMFEVIIQNLVILCDPLFLILL